MREGERRKKSSPPSICCEAPTEYVITSMQGHRPSPNLHKQVRTTVNAFARSATRPPHNLHGTREKMLSSDGMSRGRNYEDEVQTSWDTCRGQTNTTTTSSCSTLIGSLSNGCEIEPKVNSTMVYECSILTLAKCTQCDGTGTARIVRRPVCAVRQYCRDKREKHKKRRPKIRPHLKTTPEKRETGSRGKGRKYWRNHQTQ
jgi:hypothetical protein